jgi:hypothetical protein
LEKAHTRGRIFMRLLMRMDRGEPGADEAFLRFRAKERLHDARWQQRARRMLNLKPSARVTFADMLRTHELWDETLKERAAARAAKRALRESE